jgi:molecular chaperone HtpG
MEDEKFADQVNDIVLFSTTSETINQQESDETIISDGQNFFTTIDGYIKRINKKSEKKILYCTDEISQGTALRLWTGQGNEVLKAETVIDTQFLPWLEDRNESVIFQRVDSELDESLKEAKPELADQQGETTSENLRNIIKDALNNEKVTVQVQTLKGNDSPPAMILLPEQMRRINDIGALMEQRIPGLPENHILLVNQAHPLIEGMLKLKSGSVLIATGDVSPTEIIIKELALHIYQMAKLGVGGLETNEIANFQARSTDLMSKLVEKAL